VPRNRMAYFFAVVEDRLGLRSVTSEAPSGEGGVIEGTQLTD